MTLAHSFPVPEILASAITPVTLITGVAFLTSIMAPRFGRCIDRIRNILGQLRSLAPESAEYRNHILQLEILYGRTRILRNTMIAGGICILCVVFAISATFSNLIFDIPGPGTTLVLFLLALVALVLLTIGFIYDFLSSLNAVKLEIDHGLAHGSSRKTEASQRTLFPRTETRFPSLPARS